MLRVLVTREVLLLLGGLFEQLYNYCIVALLRRDPVG